MVVGAGWAVGCMGEVLIEIAYENSGAGPWNRNPWKEQTLCQELYTITGHRKGVQSLCLGISGSHMEKKNQAWLKTVGKVVTLIFLFQPSSQNQGRKEAQYHKDPDKAHQHFWKACAHV